jgi:energy-coupling factor transporter ATP-binding protein EcfA2
VIQFLEHLVSSIWNRLRDKHSNSGKETAGLSLGSQVVDDAVSRRSYTLSCTRRTTHVAVLGKTGSGKSSLLRYMAQQDIAAGRGFIWFDLHGDATPFLLRTIAEREQKLERHLSDRVVLIAPADREVSVGFNPLEQESPDFVRIVEFAAILKQRWSLDHFGARTDELLRNSLFVLAANGLTLLELDPLLTNPGFRAACLKNVRNTDVRQYFETRYGQASEPMRAVMREPILNKTSAFTADPNFRDIVGQRKSTFSMREAMDRGYWVIADLDKGRLGEQALTLASLLFTVLKNALFTRERRSLFTIYADEIQNLVAFDSGIETVLSEARKFGVSVVSANQFLDQYPAPMRAAILSVGTHVFFQLSSSDATTVAQALDGGKSLAERLKNLPQRHFIGKSGAERWTEVAAHTVADPKVSNADLLKRVRTQSARPRTEIEREIGERHAALHKSTDEVLHGWD